MSGRPGVPRRAAIVAIVAAGAAVLALAAAPGRAPPAAGAARAAAVQRRAPARPAPKPAAPQRTPLQIAQEARAEEDAGAYALAADQLRLLRRRQGPDADVELALALDEARIGLADSAWARLHGPLLAAALDDTAGSQRRHDYPFQREDTWVNGRFDGWYWYVARARAELALARGDWSEAYRMAVRAVSARPLSGKELLLLALAAGRAGDDSLADAASAWAAYLEPVLPEARYLHALWDWRHGRRAEAADGFRAAIALDSAYAEPALALARLQLPGARPDSLPVTFLTGARACARLTSAARPKLEEFVQLDRTPMLVIDPQPAPPDSLRRLLHLSQPLQMYVSVLVDENGKPRLMDLPWVTEDVLPMGVVHHVLDAIAGWQFSPPMRFGRAQRGWASVEYTIQP